MLRRDEGRYSQCGEDCVLTKLAAASLSSLPPDRRTGLDRSSRLSCLTSHTLRPVDRSIDSNPGPALSLHHLPVYSNQCVTLGNPHTHNGQVSPRHSPGGTRPSNINIRDINTIILTQRMLSPIPRSERMTMTMSGVECSLWSAVSRVCPPVVILRTAPVLFCRPGR